jgi:hypothetical protein
MPGSLEALTQLSVVVYLTVISEHEMPQDHGLMTALGQILNGEPTETEGRARIGPNAGVVRAPMPQALRHELYGFAARSRSDDADYATHGAQSSATPGLRNVPLGLVTYRWPSDSSSFRVQPGEEHMATPADQRLLELLEKWLSSLELHAKYSSLDDDSYSRIQPWPEHQRPSRWIIDLARQKALALQAQVQERIKMGDAKFSDSLELMTFLANLVGSEHIERYIPLADADNERSLSSQAPDAQPPAPPTLTATATREMPRFLVEKQRTAPPAATGNVARAERKAADIKAAAKGAAKMPAKPASKAAKPAAPSTAKSAPASTANPGASAASPGAARSGSTYDKNGPSEAAREQVIADATRLVQWGRKWYELAELIASMADRPHLTDVRRILKDNKAVIDKKAGRG